MVASSSANKFVRSEHSPNQTSSGILKRPSQSASKLATSFGTINLDVMTPTEMLELKKVLDEKLKIDTLKSNEKSNGKGSSSNKKNHMTNNQTFQNDSAQR